MFKRVLVILLLLMFSIGTDSIELVYIPNREEVKDELASCLDIIRSREGLSLGSYYCTAGKKTIGYGHVMLANDPKRIDSIYAERLLEADFESCLSEAELLIGRRDLGLALFLYGIGSTKFRGSGLHRSMLRGDDPWEYWRRWNKIPGKSEERVIELRRQEYEYYGRCSG